MSIHEKYSQIIKEEMRFIDSKKDCRIYNPTYMCSLAYQILQVAQNSTVLRCCGPMGHLTDDTVAYESVGAHTNLVDTLVTSGLNHIYGWGVNPPNYDRCTISAASKIHDLPENILGDTPNNSLHKKDEEKKSRIEDFYWENYTALYPDDAPSELILQLVKEMRTQSSPEGRLLYTADKLSAIIAALHYDQLFLQDKIPHPPMAHPSDPEISPENRAAMAVADLEPFIGHFLLSEIWTADFLSQRKLTQFDDSGFFTAILIMATLICHDSAWYSWRDKEYI